jgi:hypothetical protein
MFWRHCTRCLLNTASQSLFALTTDPEFHCQAPTGLAEKDRHQTNANLSRAVPWENGYNERFNGSLPKEVLNAEWFHTTRQAQVAINVWLRQYNRIRPHHALNMRTPIPETLLEKPKINGRI